MRWNEVVYFLAGTPWGFALGFVVSQRFSRKDKIDDSLESRPTGITPSGVGWVQAEPASKNTGIKWVKEWLGIK